MHGLLLGCKARLADVLKIYRASPAFRSFPDLLENRHKLPMRCPAICHL